MLSRPGEFNPNNFGISLLPAMMSDYGKKIKNKKQLIFIKAKQGFSRNHEINCLTNYVERAQ
jgi:hypothetical protein